MLVIVEGSHQNGLEKTKAEYMLSYTHTLNRALQIYRCSKGLSVTECDCGMIIRKNWW